MSCLICNSNLKNKIEISDCRLGAESISISEKEKTLVSSELILKNFCDYFNIKLPPGSVNWDLRNEIFPFCVGCEQIVEDLVELNWKFQLLREQLNEVENLIKSKIKDIRKNYYGSENISKTWTTLDVRIQTVRDLIVGPRIKLSRISLTSVKITPEVSIKEDLGLTELPDGDFEQSFEGNSISEGSACYPAEIPDRVVEADQEDNNGSVRTVRRSRRSMGDKADEFSHGNIFKEVAVKVVKSYQDDNSGSVQRNRGGLKQKPEETSSELVHIFENSEGAEEINEESIARYESSTHGFDGDDSGDSDFILPDDAVTTLELDKNLETKVIGNLRARSNGQKKQKKVKSERKPNVISLGDDKFRFRELEFSGNSKSGFKCLQCTNSSHIFWKQCHLLVHMKRNHLTERGSFQCPTCEQVYATDDSLRKHMKRHELPKEVRICEICGKECRGVDSLKGHIYLVHRKEAEEICETCGKKFKTKTCLKKHISSVHLQKSLVFCEICGKGFRNKNFVETHLRSTHRREFSFNCEFCDQRFRVKNGWKNHMHLFHPEVAQTICPRATYNVNKGANKDDNESSFGDVNLRCKYCGLQYNRQNNLTRHLLQIHKINVKGLSWKGGAPKTILAKVTPNYDSVVQNTGNRGEQDQVDESSANSISYPSENVPNQQHRNKNEVFLQALVDPGTAGLLLV